MLYLQTLSFGFRKRLVIGEFPNTIRDPRAETLFEFLECHVAILDRVMQYCRDDKIVVVDLTYIYQQICDLERMVNVGLAVAALSSLILVLVGREARGVKDLSKV